MRLALGVQMLITLTNGTSSWDPELPLEPTVGRAGAGSSPSSSSPSLSPINRACRGLLARQRCGFQSQPRHSGVERRREPWTLRSVASSAAQTSGLPKSRSPFYHSIHSTDMYPAATVCQALGPLVKKTAPLPSWKLLFRG